jgi:hypothetical protein
MMISTYFSHLNERICVFYSITKVSDTTNLYHIHNDDTHYIIIKYSPTKKYLSYINKLYNIDKDTINMYLDIEREKYDNIIDLSFREYMVNNNVDITNVYIDTKIIKSQNHYNYEYHTSTDNLYYVNIIRRYSNNKITKSL